MSTSNVKVLVSLPPDLVKKLDRKADKSGTNRSEEIRLAVELSFNGKSAKKVKK